LGKKCGWCLGKKEKGPFSQRYDGLGDSFITQKEKKKN